MGNDKASARALEERALPGRAVTAAVCVGLALLILLVFAQVGNFDFVSLDDDVHVYDNPHVRTGLSAQNVAWAFGTHGPGQWHPLAYVSHQGVYEYFGADARPHHLVNLAFHVASVIVLLLALRKMTGRLWPSAFVAALFGLHPLSVESVAWVCERRDVMCGLFWMLTLWAYAGYAQRGGPYRYLLVALCCALALMSKPMAVTLPCVLLLLDFWPLRRTPFGTRPEDENVTGAPLACPPRSLRFLLLEKLPLLGLVAVSSVLSILSHQHAVVSLESIPLHLRVANALVAYVVYLRKMIWPADLCVWYPHPVTQPSFQLASFVWAAVAAALLLLAITALVLYQWQRRPYLAVGWFWYLGVLFPVSGLLQVGELAYADRFTYLPLVGIYIAIVWGTTELISRWRFGQLAVKVVTPVLLVACMTATSIQIATWRDSRTLYEHALSKTKDNWLIHYTLAATLEEWGFLQDALVHFQHALRIRPGYAETHDNLGAVLAGLERLPEAVTHFEQAVRIEPDNASAHYNLGGARWVLGHPENSLVHFQEAVRIEPDHADAQRSWGGALAELGRHQEAIAHYREALQIKPDIPEIHDAWGNALQAMGRYEEAVGYYQQALRIKPDYAEAHINLAAALRKVRRPADAIGHYQQALRIDPDNAGAHYNLGSTLWGLGQPAESLGHFQKAVRIKPDHADAQRNWGGALAELGRPQEAIAHFRKALQIKPDMPETHYAWGNALKAMGRFKEAIGHYQEALKIKPDVAEVHVNWGVALQGAGRFADAIAHYKEAVRIKPDFAEAHNNLAWLLATCPEDPIRDGEQALAHAERAVELVGDDNASLLDSLSAAYAQLGDFQQAVQWQEKAVEMAGKENKDDLAARLKLYEQGQPFREKP